MTPIVEDDGRGVNVPPSKASNVSTKESTEKTMDAADATETSNKTKLNEDATKIVRAIKKLHVPAKSNSSLDGCELEKKKGIQLKNGVQLSYNVDVLKKNVNLSDNYKSSEMCQISTEKNGLKSEKENTLKCADENLSTRKSVRIEGKIVVEKNRSTKEDQDFSENVQVKHEDDVIHDFDHEEWEIVDEVHTDTSTCSESCVNEKIKRKSPIQSPDPFLTPTTPLSSSVKEVTALTARLCNAAAGNSSYFQKKATSTLETTENSAEKNENSEEDNTSEEGMQMDVTKVVEQIINRLPDNENGDVVEKLNVSSELSTSSDDVKSNSPTMMSEFSLAASLKRRCKDDNGEKSPLVCTVKKVRLEADPKQECSSSALKTMLKILPKEKVKKLRRKELEELISKEISKYLTSSNYSEIARLQQKVAQLEKSVGYWRKQVGHLQKQHIEDDIAIQRKAQNLRRLGTGPVVKVVTRSVGIQVQTQIPSVLRFNRMVPSELVLGETSRSGVRNCTSTPPVSMMKLKSSSVVPVTAKPVISGAGLAKVSTAGYQSQVSKPLILSLPRTYAKTSTISNVNVTVQNRQMITTNAVTTRPVTSIANKLPASVSVSILQPKSTNLTSVSTSAPSNLVVNPVTVPTTIVPKVASVVAPSSTVRTMLDSQRRVPMDGDGKKRSTPTNVDRVMRSSTRRVDGKSESQPNAHTLNLTRAALRIFRRFMTSVGEKREIVELTPFELSQCLTNFFASAKKKDGSEYGAHTLTCIFDSIDRHLRSCNYSASVKKDEMFYRAREQMRLKRRQLQKKKSCVNVKEKSMVDIGLLKTEEEIAQDVGLFTDWMQNPPINDQRPFFHLSTSTLDIYLAQFFTMVEVDRSNVLISDTRLKRIYDNIDVYLSNRNYPMSIKRESHFRHSIECFSFREKLLQGVSLDKVESENEYLRLERERKNYFDTEECDGRKISRGWSTKESCEAESEKKELSTSLFEPDISLVEDDNEIEVETNLCDEKTTNRVKSDLEILKNFLSAKWVNENRNIENIPLTELDRLLAQFFLLWRKPDGSEHDASDLVRMHDSIHCYLKDRYYSISIKSDAQFSYSRLCMASKCYTLSQLHQMPHDIFVRQVQCLHQKGVIGNSDPVALICCLWCYFGRGFHLSTNTEHANLRWGDVELKNENGVEYLEYTGGVSNILEGKLSGTPTYKLSTVDAGEGICPVEAFKVYTKNRPVSATKLHDRFYLHVASSNAKLWFTDKALTERNVEQIQSYVRAALDKVKIGSVDIELSELKASLLNKLLQIDEAPREERRHVIPVPTVPPKETGSAKKMSDQKVKEVFVAGGHAPNTIIKTMHDVNVFRQWLSTVEKTRDFSSFPPVKLNRLLLGFFSTLKKRDGSDYEPNSLYSIYFSIDRYLRVLKYPANIKSDVSFLQCRTFFQDRRKEFDAEREAVPQHVIQRRQVDISFSDQDIECLRRRGYLGTHNPDAMLLALWYMNTVLLGIHSQRAQLHMLWGDFDLKTDVDGRSFVEYHQHASKAKLISCPPNGIATFINKKPSKIYADVKNVENCPVRLFMEFRDRRPPFTLKSDSRFYLCPGADEPNSRIWFRSVPIGRNKLGAIPSTIWNLIRKARDGDSGAVSPSVSPKPCPKQTLPTTSNDKLCISLIPFFPSTSVSSEKDNSSKLPQVIQASAISAPNVVLFPVVSTPTVGVNCSSSTTGVQIIPIV